MKRIKKLLWWLGLVISAGIICMPVVLTALGALKSSSELAGSLAPILNDTGEIIDWELLPLYPTLHHFIKLLFWTPAFFTVFWNSIKIASLIILGQMLIAVPAAWAFAAFRFRGKNLLFTLYMIVMLLPFQVTMLPSYLVLNQLELLNTQAAVILPAIFSTFPIFLIYRGFTAIPKEMLEAARIDGAGEMTIFLKIGIPLGSPGILSAAVLGFLEYWNMMEQPLAFIKDKTLWPLSLYLPEIGTGQAGMALAASVLAFIPAVFVFVIGQEYLEQGIISSGIKE